MAPAIVHFLVGAGLVLVLSTPFVFRYDLDRELAVWLIPIGGVWGLAPDVHHIAPVYQAELYALHNTPWVDLFAFHYTLDRPAIRARYLESVFGSIVFFVASIAVFWSSDRLRARAIAVHSRTGRLFVRLGVTLAAGACATVVLFVAISLQEAFPAVAALVGREGVLVGGLLVIPLGAALAPVYAVGLEALTEPERTVDPIWTAGVGAAVGVTCWVGGVGFVAPLWLGVVADVSASIPMVHWGSLVTLVGYGIAFGVGYGLLRGALERPDRGRTLERITP